MGCFNNSVSVWLCIENEIQNHHNSAQVLRPFLNMLLIIILFMKDKISQSNVKDIMKRRLFDYTMAK